MWAGAFSAQAREGQTESRLSKLTLHKETKVTRAFTALYRQWRWHPAHEQRPPLHRKPDIFQQKIKIFEKIVDYSNKLLTFSQRVC